MKKRIFLLLLIPFQAVFGQNQLALDSCYTWARENYPRLKQSEIWQQISALKQESHQTSYLPKVTLNGQISYQSDVTELPVSVPGIKLPTLSKDQYNTYAGVTQNIWDGGISEANKSLENDILKRNLSELEVELYKLKEEVAEVFFTALIVDRQRAVLDAQIKKLNEQLRSIESGIRNGVLEKSAKLVLQAEILNLEQNAIQLNAAKRASVQMLSIMTGQELNTAAVFSYHAPDQRINPDFLRPEFKLFENQRTQLETQGGLLSKTRNPRLYGFGKLGYGKPGLNMLRDKFKAYYLLGIGVSWNAFDWKNTERQKQVLKLQQEMVDTQELTFARNIELLLVQQKEEMIKLETMLENGKKLVGLRTEITAASSSKLENESITASGYIQDLQAETVAKLELELHKVKLNQALEKYNLISGCN